MHAQPSSLLSPLIDLRLDRHTDLARPTRPTPEMRRAEASERASPADPSAPWLSVLIPVYNVAPYLADCLDSVCSQAAAGVEILLLDDASTDGSGRLMRALAASQPLVTCFSHPVNRGLSAARNTLLERARGDYLWFLDSDDMLAPGALAALQSIIRSGDHDLILCGCQVLHPAPGPGGRWRPGRRWKSFAGPARQPIVTASQRLHGMFAALRMEIWVRISRRQLWQDGLRFPEGRVFEDISVSPLLMHQARTVWYEPDPWVLYRHRQGSITRSQASLKKAGDQAHALLNVRHAIDPQSVDGRTRFAWSHFAAKIFIGACKSVRAATGAPSASYLKAYREAFEAASPLAADALVRAYLRRGWWIRAFRLQRWLAAAR